MANRRQGFSSITDVRARHLVHLPRSDFFSLGGVLAPFARTPGSLAPWTLSAAILVALASWDPLVRGGPFDITLLGLAAYELLIALTRQDEAS